MHSKNLVDYPTGLPEFRWDPIEHYSSISFEMATAEWRNQAKMTSRIRLRPVILDYERVRN